MDNREGVMMNPSDRPSYTHLSDPQFWSMEWERATRLSSLHKQKGTQESWIDFWNHISEGYRDRMQNESEIIDEVLQWLVSEIAITQESVILDIGSGPGTFTLPLARRVSHVVALDPAQKMIDTLMMEAERLGIFNITPLCQRWEDSNFEKAFDLVFASWSPAIRNGNSLMAMHQASRKYCCLVTSSGMENFRIRNELWERIFQEPFHSFHFHVLYPFNFLYASGFRPNLRFFQKTVYHEEPIIKCVDWYKHYFKIFIDLTPRETEIIHQYFEDQSEDGLVKVHEERSMAVMWWGVDA